MEVVIGRSEVKCVHVEQVVFNLLDKHAGITHARSLGITRKLRWQRKNVPDQSFAIPGLTWYEKPAFILANLITKKADGHSLCCRAQPKEPH